jgi:predicted short-subunit dehydrogenase-like oxidoreductase (DUF2520 family)
MAFVVKSIPSMREVAFAIEGDAPATRVARRIVRDLGAQPFAISKSAKAAYHAWGGFTSPLLVALLALAEQVAAAAGLSPSSARKRALPILRQTLDNYARFGAAAAFSGPIVRGDVEVVRKHLAMLKTQPEARAAYVALSNAALKYLPSQNASELAELLRRASKL